MPEIHAVPSSRPLASHVVGQEEPTPLGDRWVDRFWRIYDYSCYCFYFGSRDSVSILAGALAHFQLWLQQRRLAFVQ
jgi:hypothetical protein